MPRDEMDASGARPIAGAAGRIALLELLLGCEDVAASAQRAVDWLGERTASRALLCAVVEPARGRLAGVAGFRIAPAAARGLSASLEDRDDLLLAALGASLPTLIGPATGVHATNHLRVPFRGAPVLAFPLRPPGDGAAEGPAECAGLLLTPALGGAAYDDARWVAATLARQLFRLGAPRLGPDGRESVAPPALRPGSDAPPGTGSLRSGFLASMSHELRTPLNAILGYTSMLLQGMGGELSTSQRRMLTKVDSNGRHLLSLVNDVLDISRIEAERMPLAPAAFHLPELLAELCAEIEPLRPSAAVPVVARPAPPMPAICNDRGKTKQILLNLLANALKFTPAGSVTVACAFDPARRRWTVEVADTGIGIRAEDQARLFEDFAQAAPRQASGFSGAGLGLSISLRLARMMGGAMRFRSEPGRGSVFSLELGELESPARESGVMGPPVARWESQGTR